MKSELFNINDIQRMLVVPIPTIMWRINAFGLKPLEKIKQLNRTKYYYSKEQVNRLRDYFQSDKYKPLPIENNDLVLRYDVDDNKVCTIVLRSKINFQNLDLAECEKSISESKYKPYNKI